jgi:hypothetical protein
MVIGGRPRARYVLSALCAAGILTTSFVMISRPARAVLADSGSCPVAATLTIGPLGTIPATNVSFLLTSGTAGCTSLQGTNMNQWSAAGLAQGASCYAIPNLLASADFNTTAGDFGGVFSAAGGSLAAGTQWQFQSTFGQLAASGTLIGSTSYTQQCLSGATTFNFSGRLEFALQTFVPPL